MAKNWGYVPYAQATDPGAVGAGELWTDTSTNPPVVKMRNSANSGWITIGGGGTTPIGSGTAFPLTPATNDLFYRTDLALLFYYDGTRWLTTTIYELPLGTPGIAVSTLFAFNTLRNPSALDLWLLSYVSSSFVATTNDGTNNWTVDLIKRTAANVGTSLGSYSTSADTPSIYTPHTIALNAALGIATAPVISITGTKVLAPGNLTLVGNLYYRMIGV